jgi:hypothetical protein
MATVLTVKHHGIFEVFSEYCLSAIKGLAFMAGGMGGCVILGTLLLPLFLGLSFLLKLILILQYL